MPALWWVELSLIPLMGRTMSRAVFCGGCGLRKTLGSLSSNGWGCVPILLLSGLRLSSTGVCRLLVGPGLGADMWTTGRAHTNQYSLGPLLPVSLPPE